MDRSSLKRLGIRLVIPSRGRSSTIKTDKILPDWVEIIVPESEFEEYRNSTSHDIVTIPDEIKTLGTTRNYILKLFDEETIVMFDDDIDVLYCLTGEVTERIEDPEEIAAIVVNDAIMARDAGVHFFGFFQTDIRKYKAFEPFDLNTWVGGVVGVIGRKFKFADGRSKVDVDYSMQCLLVDRITWTDTRYKFNQTRDSNMGGSSIFRTRETENDDIEYLKKRWGNYLIFKEKKGKMGITLNVPLRQKVNYV